MRERLSRRRAAIVNLVILAAVLAVAGMTFWTVRGTATADGSTASTATVSTGDVTATVSANGNVVAGTTVNVDFQGSGGVVDAILVEEGDHVHTGEALARLDQTSARQALRQAQIQFASAQAAYEGTVEGQSPAERSRDAQSIAQAADSVDSARTGLTAAEQSLQLATSQQKASVRRAEAALDAARADLQSARARYRADRTEENQQAMQEAESAVDSARTALISARDNRDSSLLQARQQVASARDQLDAARTGLASARATVAVDQQGPRDSEVATAQAQVDSAQVAVEEAQTTLEQTVLRAPVAGTVAAVNGVAGEPSTSTSSSSSSDSSSDSSTDASGFVTLTGTDALQVTADVAEADIAEVEVGQDATVTLSASGKEMSATVTEVDAIETVTNNVVEYGVTVTLDDTVGVKLGQSTQVVVKTGSKQGVLRVSSSALTTVGDTTTATVQDDDGGTSTVQVVTGLEGDGFTEVLSGLSDGDRVVLPEQADSPTGFTFPGGGAIGGLR